MSLSLIPAPPQPMPPPSTLATTAAPRPFRRGRVARGIEYGLWLVSALFLGICGWVWFDATRHQTEGDREIAERSPLTEAPRGGWRPAYGSAVAKLEIPRLGLSTVIFEGTGEDVLLHGAGHLRGSALPGETGNVVVAGHRDTFFRPLRNLREGDSIDLDLGSGLRHYVVAETEIVNPETTEVLQANPRPMLTLVTCYPFYFVGSAPQRFIARCREVKEAPVAEAGKASSGLLSAGVFQEGVVQEAPLRPRRLASRRLALARAKPAVVPAVGEEPK